MNSEPTGEGGSIGSSEKFGMFEIASVGHNEETVNQFVSLVVISPAGFEILIKNFFATDSMYESTLKEPVERTSAQLPVYTDYVPEPSTSYS